MDVLERCFVVSAAAVLLSLIGFALMNLHWRKFEARKSVLRRMQRSS